MRKRFKGKHRACGLCKPGKRGLAVRWTPREEVRLKEFERSRNSGDWTRL